LLRFAAILCHTLICYDYFSRAMMRRCHDDAMPYATSAPPAIIAIDAAIDDATCCR